LTGLTKTALETEMDEHLGYPKHAVEAATQAIAQRDAVAEQGPRVSVL